MMDTDTQLIDYSPGPSQSGDSSDSEESNGSDTPYQPTQLLYTQLLDSYDRYGEDTDDAGRTQQLDAMDMETQLVEDDSFDDFREHKGIGDECTMIMPSEDEASKDTQLVNDDDGGSGTSSEKDDEVDSGLGSYDKQKTSHWLVDMAGKRRPENVPNFTSGEGSARPAQVLPNTSTRLAHDVFGDRSSGQGSESDRKHLKSGNCGAGVGNSGEMRSRDSDIPHFLKDSDPNKQTFGFHRMLGSCRQVVGHKNRCIEDRRVWESAIGGLQLVDSDPSTEEEEEEEEEEDSDKRHLNTSGTYPVAANASQSVRGRLSAYSSGNFCQQDLNKSPEPETLLMDDDWGGVNGEDLGVIGRIDEGGSNVGILDRQEVTCPDQSTSSLSRSSGGIAAVGRQSLSKVHSNSRTSGSVRTASLRASALRASSSSSSARYRQNFRGSQDEEVQNLERDGIDTPTSDIPWKTGRSAGFVTPTSRISIQNGALSSAVSAASVWSNSEKAGEHARSAEMGLLSEKLKDQIVDESNADKQERIGTSASELESSKTGDKLLSRARKLFPGNELDQDDVFSQVKEEKFHKLHSPELEDGKTGENVENLPPTISDSQTEKKLERRSSFGSGLFSQGSELSYLNFQSPGEDSQARALNMVDKLVWLNSSDISPELQLQEEKPPIRGPSTAKSSLQSRVQVAEAKAGMNDPLGVFDWVDSQHDEAGIFFASKGANALKGSSKSDAATGHPKQIVSGTRKAAVLDASGLRNKKIEKVIEKPIKPAPNTERLKGVLPKNALSCRDNKSEQHMRLGKDSTSAGLTSNFREPGRVQTASSLNAFGQTIANNASHHSRVVKSVEGATPTASVHNSRSEVTLLHRSTGLPGGQGGVLPKISGLRDTEHVSRASEQHLKIPDVQKCSSRSISDKEEAESVIATRCKIGSNLPNSPTTAVQKGKSPVTSPRVNRPEGFQEAAGSSKNDKAEAKSGVCVPKLSHPRKVDEVNQESEGMHTASKEMVCMNSSKVLNPVQEVGNCRGMRTVDLSDVPPPCSPRMPGDGDDQARFREAVLQPQNPESAVREESSGEPRVEPENLVGVDGLPGNDCMDCDMDSSVGAPGSVSSTFLFPEKEEENAEVVSVREYNMGPDTLGAVEAMEMMGGDLLATNGEIAEEPARDQETTNLPRSDDDKTTGLRSETNDGVEARRIVTRRSRTQGRQCPRAEVIGLLKGYQHSKMRARNRISEITDPSSEKMNMFKDRPRNRRVRWAGPLEQLPRTAEVRRGRSARQQQNASTEEEDANHFRPSSDQDDAEDVNDAENVDRKRKAESLDIEASKDSDLDKIKKRFNMSDAAVARLLGTDEDEDTKLSDNLGIKTRSLSHIQPEAEEDEPVGAPKVRKAGKGLRSSRSRGDDAFINGRRKRACMIPSDQDKQGGEVRTGSPCDTDAAETSVERTACVEMHPSDNEALPGRRRMRSIADVSSPSLKNAIPGRPPQGTSIRGGRGRRSCRTPPEQMADYSDAEQLDVPPVFSPIRGRLRGKARSARKRKELEPVTVDVNTTSPTSSKEASTTSSREASKRRKGETITCVLFSHGLPEDVGKQQRKTLAKLGGRATSSAADCTHFVADKFVRTGNMLEAMAAGKPVVTAAWLDSCLEAKCFVNEQPYILQDTKKEVEMGFSMISTLSEAQQEPLLQGIRVYITPRTSPGPEALARIVKSAGGQVVSEYIGPAPDGERKSDFCLVLSSEEELELCSPLLEQGAKVFTPELLLSGVMCHNLDFSNDQLFQNLTNKRRRASVSRRTTL